VTIARHRVSHGALAVAAALALVASLVLSACGASAGRAKDDRRIYVAITDSPTDFDPRVGISESSQRVHQLIFSSLFTLDANLRVVPELATGWTSPDPLTYLVPLRRGVRFHDGSELTADDVVFTYRSFLDPKFISGRKGAYAALRAVDAVDRYTVRFQLAEPFGSFPMQLVMGIVRAGATNVSTQPMGTGPYVFDFAAPDDKVVVRRFDAYFNGPARNAGVVLKVIPDDTMRGLELRKGEIDVVVNDLSPDIVRELERTGQVAVTTAPGVDYAYVGLNVRDPQLKDVRVRQALAYAVDRGAIVNHLRRGLATPAAGILPPMSWAYDPALPDFPHDPARARRLLDEAGYRDPDGDGPRPRFTLIMKSSTVEFTRLQATVLQQDFKRVGVDLVVRSYEFGTFLSDIIRGNFQLCTLQWVGVTDPDMLRRVYHSSQVPPTGWNRGFFTDPAVDALVERASRSTDDAERRRLYGEAQRRVADAVPAISLWHKTNVVIAQRHVSGVALSPTAHFSLLKDISRQ